MANKASRRGRFDAEQRELVALADSLAEEQWRRPPSLCDRWTVRDVVIHTAWHIRLELRKLCSENAAALHRHRLPAPVPPLG
jgi:hypothetical protein